MRLSSLVTSCRSLHGSFTINGSNATQKQVASLVHDKYKISVTNLLSFLPQDKVGSFSSYTPQQLLSSTMLGINPKFMHAVHHRLCAMENEVRTSSCRAGRYLDANVDAANLAASFVRRSRRTRGGTTRPRSKSCSSSYRNGTGSRRARRR